MRILIIDDDAVCRKLMSSALRRKGVITEATDGKIAMAAVRDALLAKSPFDLITLDIMMPDMDGHSVLMAIRSLEAVAGIPIGNGTPIIMTSALNDGRNVLGAFREMANGYLTKPIDLDKLHATCRELGLEP